MREPTSEEIASELNVYPIPQEKWIRKAGRLYNRKLLEWGNEECDVYNHRQWNGVWVSKRRFDCPYCMEQLKQDVA